MDEQNKVQEVEQDSGQKEHKKKCGFCPLNEKCPISGKPYICAGILLVGGYLIFK